MRASFESKRRKVLIKSSLDNSEELQQSKSSLRETVNSYQPHNKANQSSQTLRKALEQVQVVLLEEKETREFLEEKVTKIYQRSIMREDQFRRLLQETIPFCSAERGKALTSNLSIIQNKLLQFFDLTNKKAQDSMLEQKKALEQQMQRRINQITTHMQDELQHNKRMMKLNYETIHRQIAQIIRLSSAVLNQNQTMKKELDKLRFNNGILKEEKQLIMNQLFLKKDMIVRMHKELKNKYNKDDLIEQQIAILKRQRKEVEKEYEKYERNVRDADGFIRSIDKIHPKCQSLFTTQEGSYNKLQSAKKSNSKSIGNTLETLESNSNEKKTAPRRFFTTSDSQGRTDRKTTHIKQLGQTESNSMMGSRISQGELNRMISRLREDLKKEKKKVADLTKKIIQFQDYQQDVDKIINDIMKSDKTEGTDGSNSKKSEKIQKLMKELGRRLLMSENPVVNSGFEDSLKLFDLD